MKRIIVSFFALAIFSVGFSSAQNVEEIFVKFCNDWLSNLNSRATLSLNPGEQKDICIYAENHSDKPAKISYSFPSGKLTDWGTQTCEIWTGFEKFLTEKNERVIMLSGRSQQTIKEKVMVPLGMSGMIYGCLAYNVELPEDSTKQTGMFKIVVRKVDFLNLFIGGDSVIKNSVSFLPLTGGVFVTNAKIKAVVWTDNTVTLSFLVKNNGNVSQNVFLSGMMYNFLGFQKPFTSGDTPKKVMPGDTVQFDIEAGMIPSYKWLYDLRVSLAATPFFDFVPSGLDPKLLASTSLVETAKFFVFSWMWVIVVLLVLGLLVKFFWPKKKSEIQSSVTPVSTPVAPTV